MRTEGASKRETNWKKGATNSLSLFFRNAGKDGGWQVGVEKSTNDATEYCKNFKFANEHTAVTHYRGGFLYQNCPKLGGASSKIITCELVSDT